MAEFAPAKAPGDVLDYTWTPDLNDGETLNVVTATPSGITIDSEAKAGADLQYQMTLSAGTDNTVATIAMSATTDAGNTYTETIYIPITSSALSEPVTETQLRQYLRDAPDSKDDLLSLIIAARLLIEKQASLALARRTFVDRLDGWPGYGVMNEWWDGVREGAIGMQAGSALEVRRSPLVSVTSIVTTDSAGNDSTFDASNYYTDTDNIPGRIVLVPGSVWPALTRPVGAIAITYVAGYGAAECPHDLRQAVLQTCAHLYENRGDDMIEMSIPAPAERIIDANRVMRL